MAPCCHHMATSRPEIQTFSFQLAGEKPAKKLGRIRIKPMENFIWLAAIPILGLICAGLLILSSQKLTGIIDPAVQRLRLTLLEHLATDRIGGKASMKSRHFQRPSSARWSSLSPRRSELVRLRAAGGLRGGAGPLFDLPELRGRLSLCGSERPDHGAGLACQGDPWAVS